MKSEERINASPLSESEIRELKNRTEIIIYRSVDGKVKIDCRLEGETLWLTQAQIAELFCVNGR